VNITIEDEVINKFEDFNIDINQPQLKIGYKCKIGVLSGKRTDYLQWNTVYLINVDNIQNL